MGKVTVVRAQPSFDQNHSFWPDFSVRLQRHLLTVPSYTQNRSCTVAKLCLVSVRNAFVAICTVQRTSSQPAYVAMPGCGAMYKFLHPLLLKVLLDAYLRRRRQCHWPQNKTLACPGKLSCRDMIWIAASKGNQILGLIRRTITYKEKHLIVPLYKAIVRPHLEYCIQAWRPYRKKRHR